MEIRVAHNMKYISGLNSFTLDVRNRFSALPDFARISGSGTGSTTPHEYN
jgi:hypothetical protein